MCRCGTTRQDTTGCTGAQRRLTPCCMPLTGSSRPARRCCTARSCTCCPTRRRASTCRWAARLLGTMYKLQTKAQWMSLGARTVARRAGRGAVAAAVDRNLVGGARGAARHARPREVVETPIARHGAPDAVRRVGRRGRGARQAWLRPVGREAGGRVEARGARGLVRARDAVGEAADVARVGVPSNTAHIWREI